MEKVTGAATFVTDVSVPGMLCGKILRSPIPHGRIVRIDVTAACSVPGVVAVLTGDDLDGLEPRYGVFLRDRPVIAIDKVRYVGEPIVAVAAEDEPAAEEALEAIGVEYAELPFVTDADEALAPDAPLVHETFDLLTDFSFKGRASPVAGTNIFHRYTYRHGDPGVAMAAADHVFEDTFTFPMVYHYAMEPHAAVAVFENGGLTVWTGTQLPFIVQKGLAQVFRLPLNKVRVIVPYVGGGFGSKGSIKVEALAAALAWKAGRPVRVALSVHESMLTARRLSAHSTVRTGVRRDGTIVAKTIRVVLNGGAYADNAPAVAIKAATRHIGPYRVPHLALEAVAVYTNTVPGTAFRSIGGPQAVWATESQMDMIARALAMDPLELRHRNLVHKGDPIRPDLRPLDVDLSEGLGIVTQELAAPEEGGTSAPAARGLAVGATDPGIMLVSSALVRLAADGSAVALVSGVEIGQGLRTALAAIVADELGLAPESVTVTMPDTAITPFDWGTAASRSTVVLGLALQRAATDVKRQLVEMAADVLDMRADAVRLAEGRVSDGDRSCSIRELFHLGFEMDGGEVVGHCLITPRTVDAKLRQPPLFWETAVGGCTIAVDSDTGQIRVKRYVSVTDAGRVLNRVAAEGQEEGAAVQGLGHALFEELRYDDGHLLNGTLMDYRVPTIEDVPAEFVTVLLESGDGPGPGGARGIGEGGILPMAPAIANALERAYGIRIRELPLTPERVWRALRRGRDE